jgi:hypothetical protein
MPHGSHGVTYRFQNPHKVRCSDPEYSIFGSHGLREQTEDSEGPQLAAPHSITPPGRDGCPGI